MYTKVFEANTLDEAFRNIKKELGPDAIIIKTVTNKGLKGAFKKARVEVHASISEKNYTKKARVDAVLNDGQKEKLYSGPSSVVSNVIDSYEEHSGPESATRVVKNIGYGNMALNRPVKTVKEIGGKIKSGLDDFLGGDLFNSTGESKSINPAPTGEKKIVSDFAGGEQKISPPSNQMDTYKELYKLQKEKSLELEKKIYDLAREVRNLDRKGPAGIYNLRTTMRTFGISEKFITALCKKALFNLPEDELEDSDMVFEFALKEMLGTVKVDRPLFSSDRVGDGQAVTVVLGGHSSGQTSMVCKMAALKPDSTIVRSKPSRLNFTEKVFGIESLEAKSVADMVSLSSKELAKGKNVFIDYESFSSEDGEAKKFVDGLRRSFEFVEILIGLSAVHSEIHNLRKINLYRPLSDGIVVSNIDLCLNFGLLFNVAEEAFDLPFKFFGTGEVVPDDIEAATPERILAGIFQLA